MLFLLFQAGKDRYALSTRDVIEVLPMVELKRMPGAPAPVAGLFNYRGKPVPVIDLTQCLLNQPARQSLSTRIILINQPDASGEGHVLGLIAERAIETVQRKPEDFVEGGVTNPVTPWLGPVANDPRGLIQWVNADKLLPDNIREMLFHGALEATS